ncbi:hypothetical protein [Streptomyces sp. NPDC002588]|uniref:hypothetical protein n=1 Tax=Streptomyces sp. NPDC002588 TaxID=3154419 RepID=UPI00331E1FCC
MRVTTRTLVCLVLSASVLVGLVSTVVGATRGSGERVVGSATVGTNSVIWD